MKNKSVQVKVALCLGIFFGILTVYSSLNMQFLLPSETFAVQPGIGGGPDAEHEVLSDIATHPNNFLNATVTLSNVQVHQIFSPNIFSVIYQHKELLVISSYTSPPRINQEITVQGVVRRLPTLEVLENEWKLEQPLPNSINDLPIFIQETSI